MFDPAVPPWFRPTTVAGIATMMVLSLVGPILAVGSARQMSGADPILLLVAERRAATTPTGATQVEDRPLADITS